MAASFPAWFVHIMLAWRMGDRMASESHMRRAIELSLDMMRNGKGGPFGAVIVKDGNVVEERQPYLRGGAQEPLTRQDVVDKFALNVAHGGWSKVQGEAALKLLAGLYKSKIDLHALRN